MRVEDFDYDLDVENEAELERALNRRFEKGVNGFWLHRDRSDGLPTLSILVNGDLASVTYFANDHPGFRAIGNVEGLNPGGTSIFFLDNPKQEEETPNKFVIPFPQALRIAKEFLQSPDLPSSAEWFEL